MPDRRVRRRHGVEAVDLVHLVVERPAHDQPHHHLDAFGAGLAHVVEMRDARELLGVLAEVVEEALVPFAVDQTGARAADLVRQPAGAEDHDLDVLGIGLDRLADRLAQHVAAVPGRRRIHDHVDRQRNDLERPFLLRVLLAAQEVERHRQAVIDLHLVDDGQVELVENDRLRDVSGERGVALDHRHRPRPPALVGGRELGGAAEREGRDEIDRECRRMVVVDHDRNIRLGFAHPRLRPLEAREHPLPVGFLGPVIVERRADGGNVRRAYTCDDRCHGSLPLC